MASWGSMLTLGSTKYIHTQPRQVLFPGAAISLGDALRDARDPKLRDR